MLGLWAVGRVRHADKKGQDDETVAYASILVWRELTDRDGLDVLDGATHERCQERERETHTHTARQGERGRPCALVCVWLSCQCSPSRRCHTKEEDRCIHRRHNQRQSLRDPHTESCGKQFNQTDTSRQQEKQHRGEDDNDDDNVPVEGIVAAATARVIKTRLTWVNGVGYSLQHMEEGKKWLSDVFGGKEVLYCHNPTSKAHDDDTMGYLGDLTQAGTQKLGRTTEEVNSLVE